MADPVSWLLIERGWDVVDRDDARIGEVERVLGDEQKDIFDGLAVQVGLLGRPKYVASERVRGIVVGCVSTDLARNEVDELDETE